jgi:hypothetical protein
MKSQIMTITAIGLVALALGAPSVAHSKDEPVVHIVNGLNNGAGGGLDLATILGPMPFGTTMEISTITTANLSQRSVVVQYRFVQPDVAEEPADCIGDGGTYDELMRVVVPGYETVHLTFPDSLNIPGQYINGFGVNEPLPPGTVIPGPPTDIVVPGPWCLIAFYANVGSLGLPPADQLVDVRVSGRVIP